MLRKIILNILMVIMILNTTSLYQVFKLPSLIRHYTEHKILNQNINFGDFLAMHYWGEDIDDNDDEKDMQLPFKKMDLQQSGVLFLPAINSFVIRSISWPPEKTDYGPGRSQVHFNTHLGALFRPPRV